MTTTLSGRAALERIAAAGARRRPASSVHRHVERACVVAEHTLRFALGEKFTLSCPADDAALRAWPAPSGGRHVAKATSESVDETFYCLFEADLIDSLARCFFRSAPRYARDAQARAGAPPSSIEIALVTAMAESLLEGLESELSGLKPAGFAFVGCAPLDDVFAAREEFGSAAAIRVRAVADTPLGECTLVFPTAFLSAYVDAGEADIGDEWTRSLESRVAAAPLSVSAVLDEFDMALADVAKLKPGSILPLNAAVAEPVRLHFAGRPLLSATVARDDRGYRLAIQGEAGEGTRA